MILVVSFLLHLAISTMGSIFIKSVVFLSLLGEGGWGGGEDSNFSMIWGIYQAQFAFTGIGRVAML